MSKENIYPIAIITTLLCFMFGCATVSSPSGGPRDSLAPVLVGSGPAPYTTNYDGKKVILVFDEYVQLKDQSTEFFISPPMATKPTLTAKNKSIIVDITDTLMPETTYRLDFGNAIADNNEGNKLRDFHFIFSTGDYIDSLFMVGQTTDALTKDTIMNSYILFFDPVADSLEQDSTLQNSLAQVMVRSDSMGLFVADILKEKDYRIYALSDQNANQKYEAGTDLVGFLDGTFNPALMDDVMLSYDSTKRRWDIMNPQIHFEMFVEDPPRRQTILESTRTEALKMQILFNAQNAVVDSLEFLNISSEIVLPKWNPTRDSLTIWLMPQTKQQMDSLPAQIEANITYERQDSVWQSYSHSEKISFSYAKAGAAAYKMSPEDSARMVAYQQWKDLKEAKRAARLAKRGKTEMDSLRKRKAFVADSIKTEKKRADSIKNAKPTKNPFSITVNSSNEFIPLTDLIFDFQYPLRRMDKDSISLRVTPVEQEQVGGRKIAESQATEAIDAPFTLEQDSLVPTRWHLRREWISGELYELEILKGGIENMAFESNDTLRSKFTVASPEKYGTLIYQVTADSLQRSDVSYIIQLIKPNAKKETPPISQSFYTPGDEEIRLEYVKAGNYNIRIIEDKNQNGVWDTGSLTDRRHAERVRIWTLNNSKEVISKENWELPIEIDLSELFNN
ncbi:MAG: Ig-like domain-containing protein [Rikenellaceae bacterium]